MENSKKRLIVIIYYKNSFQDIIDREIFMILNNRIFFLNSTQFELNITPFFLS